MLTSPFFRRLFLPYLAVIGLAIAVVGIVGAAQLRSSYLERTERELHDSSLLIAELVRPQLRSQATPELQALVQRLGQSIGRRITLINNDGTVLADNEADPATMENHRLRTEIQAAASRGQGQGIRPSGTLHADLMYYALRTQGSDGQIYFVRVAVHLTELSQRLRTFYAALGAAALLAMLGAVATSYYFARRQAGPLLQLTAFARGLSQGDLNRRILDSPPGEMGLLCQALNTMADSLSRLLAQTAQDKGQLLAVLSSMSEGVIATDTRQHLLLSNDAAAELLEFSASGAPGRLLWETVRHQPILQAADEVLRSRLRRSFTLGPLAGRHLEITLCTFPAQGAPEGLVIVIHDATQAVRYQELRKEFVANVSHELRTPLSAIKGYAETLREGALLDPERAHPYLATIEKHADQLANLVNDLLELSRLESHAARPGTGAVDPAALARKAADWLRPAAQRKNQTLDLDIPPDPPAVLGQPDYLERAIANLLDNAIKYTPEGGHIRLSLHADAGSLIIEVADNGIGIPAEDLPRIFERFYRVDRSRSRDMGGTGLGLSIVKHIAQAHKGKVEVTSTPGHGSTFRLILPLEPQQEAARSLTGPIAKGA